MSASKNFSLSRWAIATLNNSHAKHIPLNHTFYPTSLLDYIYYIIVSTALSASQIIPNPTEFYRINNHYQKNPHNNPQIPYGPHCSGTVPPITLLNRIVGKALYLLYRFLPKVPEHPELRRGV